MIDLLQREGINELNPMQKDAFNAGITKGKNIVIAAPTASGKTLCAEMAIAEKAKIGMCIYIVPLRALAEDKYSSFKNIFYDLKVGLATGDYDSNARELEKYDLLVVTPEKMDSILRHAPEWLKKISLVVADEVHLIDDVERGPNMEIVLSRLKYLLPSAQIIALSATIKNCDEIAAWLDATLIKSDYRPVKLNKGVFYDNIIWLEEKTEEAEDVESCFEKLVKNGKQGIIFVSTRRSAEAVAEKLAEAQKDVVMPKLAKKMNSSSEITSQTKRLAKCIKKGIAFHHAGLTSKERKVVQKGFKEKKLIKGIVCTTTLAMGIDYPASVVIVRDLKRYDGMGMDYLPILEVQQMIGRAGRPRYDKEGTAVLICKNSEEARLVSDIYFNGESEPIYSKMGVEPVLRFHILASIASGYTNTYESLEKFISSTFYAFQYGDLQEILGKVENILAELEKMGFINIKKSDKTIFLSATPIGRKISELYIDPITADRIMKAMEIGEKKGYGEIGATMMVCDAQEMTSVNVSKKEESELWNEMYMNSKEMLMNESEFLFAGYNLLPKYKTAKIFIDWINEKNEESIMEQYGIPPGILFNKKRVAQWLFYSAAEIARMKRFEKSRDYMKKMEIRIEKGIKEELLPLVKIKGIGRVRARKLFNSGYDNYEKIKNESPEKIKKIIGVELKN